MQYRLFHHALIKSVSLVIISTAPANPLTHKSHEMGINKIKII